ncbi:unnamed protein product [Citrullus colocynthis]|uniref:Uncharacterized protein n=1 Tax=Citrullus colocynthis TaxID=252529 RepID=A0ABP0YQC8_9ROSI
MKIYCKIQDPTLGKEEEQMEKHFRRKLRLYKDKMFVKRKMAQRVAESAQRRTILFRTHFSYKRCQKYRAIIILAVITERKENGTKNIKARGTAEAAKEKYESPGRCGSAN